MQKGILEIRAGTLIDGSGDAPRKNVTIRIKDGRIDELLEVGKTPKGAGAPAERVIDASDKTVLPGLIDAHCHISYGEGCSAEDVDIYGAPEWAAVRGVWNANKVLRAGFTSFCDCGSTWNVAVTVRDAIVNEMFPGPRIYAAGRHIVADGGFADYFPSWLGMPDSAEGVLCPTREAMESEVRKQIKNRVDLIKISGDSQAQERISDAGPCFSDEEMCAIVGTANRLGRRTTIHARYAETVLAAAKARVNWIIHASYWRRQDVGIVRDARVPICPTLTFTANIVEWGKDVGVSPSYMEIKKRELDALAEIHQCAHKAGVTMMAGSEAGFSITPYGEWHARELELLVSVVGLSPMAAIVAATKNNAAAFGWDGDLGMLKPGFKADLIVVDGDPLSDIRVLGDQKRIKAVFKDGNEVDRTTPIADRRRMAHERSFTISAQPLHRFAVH